MLQHRGGQRVCRAHEETSTQPLPIVCRGPAWQAMLMHCVVSSCQVEVPLTFHARLELWQVSFIQGVEVLADGAA